MKICPNCDFENFNRRVLCERCAHRIWEIRNEQFDIVNFIVRNSSVYVVISVLIALSAFLIDPTLFGSASTTILTSQITMIIVVPLFFSFYLIIQLSLKAWSYVDFHDSNISQDIRVYLYVLIHGMVIFGFFLILTKTNNLGSFCLLTGIVAVAEFLSTVENKAMIAKIIVVAATFLTLVGGYIFLNWPKIYSISGSVILTEFSMWFSIFILFFGIGELIGTFIYYVMFQFKSELPNETQLENIRNYFVITGSEINLDIILGVLILIIVVIGPMLIFHN
jgi:hypothetical protein